MIFIETGLDGAYTIELERHEDDRGFFARTFCQSEFEAKGLKARVAQTSVASNRKTGTVRGMHFQYPPSAEAKLVRCTRGAVLDIIVDLRPESPSYLQHIAVELSEDNQRGLYVPERFAHGYQVLRDHTDVAYQMSEFHAPGLARGLKYDDPALGLRWPLAVSVISAADRAWPLLGEIEPDLKRRMACS